MDYKSLSGQDLWLSQTVNSVDSEFTIERVDALRPVLFQ